MNQQSGDDAPPIETLSELEHTCLRVRDDIVGTVREEHPEAVEQVIAEREL